MQILYNAIHYTEARACIREGNTVKGIAEDYDISQYKVRQLLSGKIKEIIVGKNSIAYDPDYTTGEIGRT